MNATISARILDHFSQGMTLEQAIDAVVGAGAYAQLAGEIHDQLRARQAILDRSKEG